MSKRFTVLLVVLLVAIVGVVAWQLLRSREPLYNGKPLSAWVSGYHLGGSAWTEADTAVRQTGTNSIPILLRMLRQRDSALKVLFMGMAKKQHVVKFRFISASIRNEDGAEGFRSLGAEGQSAVPALIDIYNQNLSVKSRNETANALAWIGPPAKDAMPSLLRQTTNTDASVRGSAVRALGMIRAEPDVVVPVLQRALKDSSPNVRLLASQSLGMFGTSAKQAVPELAGLLKGLPKNREMTLKGVVQRAIQKIDPEAAISTEAN